MRNQKQNFFGAVVVTTASQPFNFMEFFQKVERTETVADKKLLITTRISDLSEEHHVTTLMSLFHEKPTGKNVLSKKDKLYNTLTQRLAAVKQKEFCRN